MTNLNRNANACGPGATCDTYWETQSKSRRGEYLTQLEKSVIARASARFETPGRLLDIGCDGGRWSAPFFRQGWDITCTDVRSEALDLVTARMPGATPLLVNPGDTVLPCASNQFDLVLCIECPAVTDQPWFPAEAFRALKPGGALVCTLHNSASLRGLAWKLANRIAPRWKYWGGIFYNGPTARKFVGSLSNSGFSVEFSEGYCWVPFPRMSSSPLIPICAKLERMLRLHRIPQWSPWVITVAAKPDSAVTEEHREFASSGASSIQSDNP